MGKEIKVRIVLRHNTTDGWKLIEDSEILYKGEMGLEFVAGSNVPKIKIGDGRLPWKRLEYFTVPLPESYTWGNLRGTIQENETSPTENLGLIRPSFTDTVKIDDINKNFETLDVQSAEFQQQLNNLKNQVEKFIASYPIGSTAEKDPELMGIRTRYSGVEYESAGAATRAIDEDLSHLTEQMSEFIGSSAVDGLYYEGNKLWLSSGGQLIGDPVEIVSGGGGGGGGGGSSFTVSLVNLLDSRVLSLAKGEKAVLKFSYSSKDAEGYTDGSGVGEVFVGGIRRLQITIPQGDNELDITELLADGDNTVKVQVTNSDGSYRSLSYTVSVISLAVTTNATDLAIYEGIVSFPYTVTGAGTKTVHFILDGNHIGKSTITTSGRSYTFDIPAQKNGGHILEVYAEVVTGTSSIKSTTLRLGMMWTSPSMAKTAILINNSTKTIVQGETINIPYLVYNRNITENQIELTILNEDGTVYSSRTLNVDTTPKIWSTQDFPLGKITFKISSDYTTANGYTVSEETQVDVTPSSFTKEIITSGLLLEFSAEGRFNTEPNPENWSYIITNDDETEEEIIASFENFGWTTVDGWISDEDTDYQTVLRFLPDNYMTIPYAPFAKQNLLANGFSIEADFTTHDVKNADTTIIASYENNMGLLIKASSAKIQSTSSTASVIFKEDSRVRVTFVVEPNTANRFIYVYINGVLCGISQYGSTGDSFTQSAILTIGAESSGLDLYSLRIYRRALSDEEQLNNFICEQSTLADRIFVDNRNNIFNESGDITIETLPMTIPYCIMECEELPQFKGDKKKGKAFEFVDRINTSRSFRAIGCQFDVQGTSSAGYPIKNYKIGLKEGITYSNNGEVDLNGFPVFEGGMSGKNICLKADFASSENANNVMLVDYYEGITPFKSIGGEEIPYPPTIEDSGAPGYIGFIDSRCRRGIRGFPCVLFWKNTNTNQIKFIGKYNFNDDKSNENVFGFNRIVNPKTECWEFCNNTSDRVIFKTTKFFEGEENATEWAAENSYSTGDIVIHNFKPYTSLADSNLSEPGIDSSWEQIPWYEELFDDFEPRFPDLDDMYNDFSAFYRVCKWINSTDTTINNTGKGILLSINGIEVEDTPSNRLRKFKEEFTHYFAKEATLFYYIFTEVFLMVDNRAKNMFLTTFNGSEWFPIPYDMDTALGILQKK